MIKLFIQFIIAILSMPVAMAVTVAFYNNFALIKELGSSLNFFFIGIASYVILHILFYKPTYLYVLGHETVHAGVAWLFGGRIKSFRVSEKGGSVGTDKSNIVIDLSPYFVPIYAIAITLVYFLIASSYRINSATFVFLIGFALAFHIISTIEIFKIRQPDIVKTGYFFSIVLIYILNIVTIALIFGLLFSSFSARKFFIDSWSASKNIYAALIRQLFF